MTGKGKMIFTILLLAIIVLPLAIYYYQFWSSPNEDQLNYVHKQIVKQVNKKWDSYVKSLPEEQRNIPDHDNLMSLLNPWETSLVKRIMAINPAELGFLGPEYGIEKAGELVTTPSKKYNFRGVDNESGINFLAPNIMTDFQKMNEAMKKDIGKELDLENGYRTPGMSAKLFLYYLETENGWSLKENAKWIAMPGYSEHNSYQHTALDLINQEGIDGQMTNQTASDFDSLPEFAWLTNHAAEYNFYLSYPKDNKYGVSYEPWHWHWEKK
jgi:zinc D-Ala-D-Ala carboxypeptidase